MWSTCVGAISASLVQIHPELEESSSICGAGLLSTLREIVLPLAWPGILSAMILVMVLTVSLNNVVAAAIVVVFSYAQGNVSILHAMVQNHVITDRLLSGLVNIVYWLFPHQLLSNLDRETAITSFHVTCAAGCPELHNQAQALAQELARLPVASGAGDIVYWFAYLMVLCTILYLAIRRKQV